MAKTTKITKEMILETALEIAREKGLEGVSNREIAKRMNSSIRPIYYQFKNVLELNKELISKINFNTVNVIGRVFYFFAKLLIPAIRYIVYWYYSKRQQKSDYYTTQATLIEMNAMQLQYNSTIDIDKRREIFNKQMKIAERYRSRANKYNVDYTVAKKNAEKMIDNENKVMKAKDLNMDSTISFDPSTSALF